MKTSTLVKSVLIGASLPLFAGCVTREVVYRDRPAPAPAPVVTEEAPAPPPPQVELVPAAPGPLAAWYWAPGCWEWRGHWVWTRGHWITRPYAHAVWLAPHWAGMDISASGSPVAGDDPWRRLAVCCVAGWPLAHAERVQALNL